MLEIITYPNQILRNSSKNVDRILDCQIQKFIPELLDTMKKKDGIGLAAPQVGKNINIIAVNLEDGARVFINPMILFFGLFKKNIVEEGCLSFPGLFGLVKRPRTIIIKYQDEKGKLRIKKVTGLLATVFQHEVDHLRGKLFIDKIFKYTKGENRLKELKNGD